MNKLVLNFNQNSTINQSSNIFIQEHAYEKVRPPNDGHFVSASMC